VETDVDVVLWRVPKFTFRRPDVVVYRCLDERGAKPEAADALIVVEVSSPSTAKEDLLDCKSQYARAGISLYLVVVMDTKYESRRSESSALTRTPVSTGCIGSIATGSCAWSTWCWRTSSWRSSPGSSMRRYGRQGPVGPGNSAQTMVRSPFS
jgi:hypothetical protein